MQVYTPEIDKLVRIEQGSLWAYYRITFVKDNGVSYSVDLEWVNGNWTPSRSCRLDVPKIECTTFPDFKNFLNRKIV